VPPPTARASKPTTGGALIAHAQPRGVSALMDAWPKQHAAGLRPGRIILTHDLRRARVNA